MSKVLSEFLPVDGFEGVFSAQVGALRCTAIRTASGNLCLYSPVLGLGQAARDSLKALGEVTHLLASNHYHHKGLGEYSEVYPAAKLCCTALAKPRLEKQTRLSFVILDETVVPFPNNAKLVEPRGLKTGEIWIQMKAGNQVLWIVTDAFCGAKSAAGKVVDKPELLGTFPRFGILDRNIYFEWLSNEVTKISPTLIVPCHGSIISGAATGVEALKLVQHLR